jgi:hypothetical protein
VSHAQRFPINAIFNANDPLAVDFYVLINISNITKHLLPATTCIYRSNETVRKQSKEEMSLSGSSKLLPKTKGSV